jgi:lipopolysaccharide/colanic/teichoic acid biosynthesis glycosyltransferase
VSPLLLLVGLLVVACDGRPILFRQQRLGRGRVPFEILKFRTMTDDRPTRLGTLLRRSGLDELPQLMNIASGSMRFIGPRPLTELDVIRLEWDTPYYDTRWRVPPGLTGLAQLSPICHRRMSWFLDDHYARHRSRLLDLKIVAASCILVVAGKDRTKAWFWR